MVPDQQSVNGRAARALSALAVALAAVLAVAPIASAESLAETFDRVSRSVVVVHTTEWDVAESSFQRTVSVSGFGSGVLISADGNILTAAHLVHAASEVSIEFPDGVRVRARVIASEPEADVSLLQVERVPAGAAVANLADSDHARVGDRVFVVGTPYGISHTLSVGHLSGRHQPGRVWDRFTRAEFFQTDAAINRGNSGGPMFNMAGEVLGVVSHIISKSGGFEGLGFVVTSNAARKLLVERKSPWWGFEGVLLTGDLLRVFNLKQPGLLVQRVVENSPAARLGLRGGVTKATIGDRTFTVGGDVILRVQGMPCDETHRVHDALAELKTGEQLALTILRHGEIVELSMIVP